jgi:hypothetical protein
MATVKVSKETYKKLNKLAGKMRASLHRPVSIDEALESAMKVDGLKPSDFAGTFIMGDREAVEISEELTKFWSRWRFQKG